MAFIRLNLSGNISYLTPEVVEYIFCSNFPTRGEATEQNLWRMTDIQLGLSQRLWVVVAILPKNEKRVKSRTILSAFVIILETYTGHFWYANMSAVILYILDLTEYILWFTALYNQPNFYTWVSYSTLDWNKISPSLYYSNSL